MSFVERFQKKFLIEHLQKRSAVLTGPRSSGKTALAKSVMQEFSSSFYLNFDHVDERKTASISLPDVELLVFDEIHKLENWQSFLKTVVPTRKVLAISSAAIGYPGYFNQRLLPLTPAECSKTGELHHISHFLERGGFPEPFLAQTLEQANLWRHHHNEFLLKDEVLDFDNVYNLKAIKHVFELLRERVGSPLSYTSISEDASISPNTVKKYVQILEDLYIIFRVQPYSRNISRSLLREPKIYFYDAALVKGDNGPKFENFVAICLMKHVLGQIDLLGKKAALQYLQTKERHEVDFALICDDKILKIIEVKYANHSIGKGLRYFHQKYQFPALQVVKELKNERVENGIEVLSGESFLKTLFV